MSNYKLRMALGFYSDYSFVRCAHMVYGLYLVIVLSIVSDSPQGVIRRHAAPITFYSLLFIPYSLLFTLIRN